jgi:V/A-type H+-transporting ATPase subunit F
MYLISDNVDTKTGMRLAGVDGAVVHSKEETKLILDKILDEKDIAIVLITEKLRDLLPEYIEDIKLNRRLPLIVVIPDRHGTGLKSDFITGYIKEAIGLKV